MGNFLSFKKEFGLIVVSALIFIASFLWKDLLSDVKNEYFPASKGLAGQVLFTIVVTIILIFLALYLRRTFGLVNSSYVDAERVKAALAFDDSPIGDGD